MCRLLFHEQIYDVNTVYLMCTVYYVNTVLSINTMYLRLTKTIQNRASNSRKLRKSLFERDTSFFSDTLRSHCKQHTLQESNRCTRCKIQDKNRCTHCKKAIGAHVARKQQVHTVAR